MDKYVDCILSVVTQRFYLLSQLKHQGLSIYVISLNILFHALSVSRIVHYMLLLLSLVFCLNTSF